MRQTPTSTPGLARSVHVGDGRRFTVSAAGPDDGFPVVYCHGAIGSPRWQVPHLEPTLERLGVRYLVIDRPGFGGSDPRPGRSVTEFAADLGEVMSALGHERFSIVGVSAGAPYALACGCGLPDRVVGLAAVSPLGPATGRGASLSFRYGVPLAAFGSARLGPVLASLALHALRLRRQTSPQAMVDDYLVCRKDWGFELSALRIPVTIWHGRCDRLVPLRHALALAAAIPGARAEVDPRGGHFFYARRLEEIMSALLPAPPAAWLEPARPALPRAA